MFNLSIDEKVSVALAITDRTGAPARVDGAPVWATSDATLLAVTAAADGLSAELVAGETADAVATVTVTADADLGDGVMPIVGVLTVALTGGRAQFIALTPGTPEPK